MDPAVEGEDVELASGVLAERCDGELLVSLAIDQLAIGNGRAVLLAQAPDPPGVVVGVDVNPRELGQGLAAIDVAAGDALAVVRALGGRLVGILDQRGRDRARRVGRQPPPRLEGVEPFLDAPTVVAPFLRMWTISYSFWPTSPAQSVPVARSKVNFQTFRRPMQ